MSWVATSVVGGKLIDGALSGGGGGGGMFGGSPSTPSSATNGDTTFQFGNRAPANNPLAWVVAGILGIVALGGLFLVLLRRKKD